MDKLKYFIDRVDTFRDSEEIIEYLDEMHSMVEDNEVVVYKELSDHIDGLWVLANELLDHIKDKKNG